MSNIFLEKLEELKRDREPAHICYFNNGNVMTSNNATAKRISSADDPKEYNAIEGVLLNVATIFSDMGNFDSFNMDMYLGLVFNVEDINGKINHDSKHIPEIVRYYTGRIKATENGEPVKDKDFSKYGYGRQGYINYNKLVEAVKSSGLEFNGPQTFEEFEEFILTGEPFDVSITANLKPQKQENETPITK
ncbi:MAG: hypothetical protein IKF71_02655 [Bacilli bacterium]|nr:hypothetical protein [Bacilli bacterium]